MKHSRILSLLLGTALWSTAQTDFTPPTPLMREVLHNNTAGAKELLEKGANPNEGRFVGFTPIFFPIVYQNLDLLRAMIAKGGDIHAKDRAGSTTLMWAAFNEYGRTELVEELLRLGVDPNAKTPQGETALTWALRRGDTPVVKLLRKAGASHEESVKTAAKNALAILEKSGPQFVKVSGCTSCHHQSLPQMAFGVAREHGISMDEQIGQQQVKTVVSFFKPLQEAMEHNTEKIPDPPISVSYSLLGLAGQGYSGDATTKAMAHLVSSLQQADGSFRTIPGRPPLESSDFTATALSLRALELYGTPAPDQIKRAGEWLRSSQPRNTEDRAMQLLGMHWAEALPSELRKAAKALLAEQRTDGGWAQLPGLETDAYATGQALVALRRAGMIDVSDAAYQRGVGYLMRTQLSDGSWLVRTRTFPFQPYKESGFPHGKDQWISAAGTSWAAMALSLSLPIPQNNESLTW